jgi:hypothetical protein
VPAGPPRLRPRVKTRTNAFVTDFHPVQWTQRLPGCGPLSASTRRGGQALCSSPLGQDTTPSECDQAPTWVDKRLPKRVPKPYRAVVAADHANMRAQAWASHPKTSTKTDEASLTLSLTVDKGKGYPPFTIGWEGLGQCVGTRDGHIPTQPFPSNFTTIFLFLRLTRAVARCATAPGQHGDGGVRVRIFRQLPESVEPLKACKVRRSASGSGRYRVRLENCKNHVSN